MKSDIYWCYWCVHNFESMSLLKEKQIKKVRGKLLWNYCTVVDFCICIISDLGFWFYWVSSHKVWLYRTWFIVYPPGVVLKEWEFGKVNRWLICAITVADWHSDPWPTTWSMGSQQSQAVAIRALCHQSVLFHSISSLVKGRKTWINELPIIFIITQLFQQVTKNLRLYTLF